VEVKFAFKNGRQKERGGRAVCKNWELFLQGEEHLLLNRDGKEERYYDQNIEKKAGADSAKGKTWWGKQRRKMHELN